MLQPIRQVLVRNQALLPRPNPRLVVRQILSQRVERNQPDLIEHIVPIHVALVHHDLQVKCECVNVDRLQLPGLEI
jgi:hypothetical protein